MTPPKRISRLRYRLSQLVAVLLVPLLVSLFAVVEVSDRIVIDGEIESAKQLDLTSPLGSTLVGKVLIEVGENVKRGQALLEFQDLGNWRLEKVRKTQRADFLAHRLKVYDKLHKMGTASELKMRELKTEEANLRTEIAALENNINRLTLRAPFAGRVTKLLVAEYTNVNIGTPLLTISDMREKVIRCFVPEDRFAQLRDGLKVAIKSNMLNFLKYDVYQGEVIAHHAYMSRAEQRISYETVIGIDGAGQEKLRIGGTATCEIITDKQPLYTLIFRTEQ